MTTPQYGGSQPEFVRAMGAVARELLGEPNRELSRKQELRFGSRGSMSVRTDKGTWHDHETGQGGGVIDLVQERKQLDKEGALGWLRDRGHLPKLDAAKSAGKREIAVYDYTSEDGELLFQVVRFEPKDFRQRQPDGSGGWLWKMAGVGRVLYRLPELAAAVAAGRRVYVAEGEKGADALARLGAAATCSPGGAGKWRRDYSKPLIGASKPLIGAEIVILPDNDDAGRQHAQSVAAALQGIAASIRVLPLPDLPEKGDVADWIAAGGTWAVLDRLADAAAEVPADSAAASKVPPVPHDLELTEHGVALVFADQHRDALRYCHHTGAWFVRTGTHWKRNETKLAFSWARQLVARLNRQAEFKTKAITGKAAFAAAVERFAQADEAFAVTSEVWDQDPFLLGTPGGTVDLRTGELRPARQSDCITKLTAVAPAVMPDCPRWLAFLEEATAGDDGLIRFLRQWFGYSLTGDTREQNLVFCYGSGENGKGVCVNTVAGILGGYARNAPMETFTASHTDRHSIELAMLRDARTVTASETEEGRAWAEARIKTLTGGDTITARFMRRDFFEYQPHFKLTFMGNHKPVLKQVDHAARRRFNMVPFLFRPPIKDPQLPDKLREEWPAILRWMIEGCLDWQMNGLIVPRVVLEATGQYFSEQDTLAQ